MDVGPQEEGGDLRITPFEKAKPHESAGRKATQLKSVTPTLHAGRVAKGGSKSGQ